MNHCLMVVSIPAVVFLSSEALSGNFSGFRSSAFNFKEALVSIVAMLSFIGQIPLAFWIDYVGTQKIRDYINRNSQILERQLMGAMARLFRQSQLARVYLVSIGTVVGLFDAMITRSQFGLIIYLIGQALLFYLLPWPYRWDFWQAIRRKLVLE
ncbi:hypothetical protein GC170_03565 [bacterium]|nr:hypothetical protein [bacterium]